jgi:hypothetical protein
MSSRRTYDTDVFDALIERHLHHWLAQRLPPHDAKEKLLRAASSVPVRRSRLRTFRALDIQGFLCKCVSLYSSISTHYPQYPEMDMHMVGAASDDILPLSIQMRLMHSFSLRRGLIFLLA